MLIGQPLFRFSFRTWYVYRATILRLFGANIGKRTFIRPSARIEVPWNLTVGDDAAIGDYAIIYSLAPIYIGARATISQYAHLCAGTHDYSDPDLKLIRKPITIGHECWIATDAFVGPGVSVGEYSVIGARSSVYKNLSLIHI